MSGAGRLTTVFETDLKGFTLLHLGKVRDLYEAGPHLLLVATDRLSAFDVILPDPIPGKGAILTALSNVWFERTASLMPNHLVDPRPWERPEFAAHADTLRWRSILVRKAKPVMIEAVVRGYLAGSGWEEYGQSGTVCGNALPAGLTASAKLPQPIFTPATKAPAGQHDENISFEQAGTHVGVAVATQVREAALALYNFAAGVAAERGIIIADTKFEFGMDGNQLLLIDEALTPDSSRFWPADGYAPGRSQPSFDKQFFRDYLVSIKFNKKPPAPKLPTEIIERTRSKYRDALARLAPGHPLLEEL